MLYAATHALFHNLSMTLIDFDENFLSRRVILQKNGEAISADPGRQKEGARKGKKEAAPLRSPPESLRIISPTSPPSRNDMSL